MNVVCEIKFSLRKLVDFIGQVTDQGDLFNADFYRLHVNHHTVLFLFRLNLNGTIEKR